jgi:DNA-binding NtrC family response regulator
MSYSPRQLVLTRMSLRADPHPDASSSMRRVAPGERGLFVVVDDMTEVRRLVEAVLTREGYAVETFPSGEACLSAMPQLVPDGVYLDLEMPGIGGLRTLDTIHSKHPGLPVIMLTADESVESVVAAMKRGAYDYLVKPPSRQKLLTLAKNAVDHYRMILQIHSLEREAADGTGYGGIVAHSRGMKEVFRQMDHVARSDITVIIHGESGTGKELVARAIHANSPRKSGPFVALNCAAIPEALQESELFGHEKGAFTGAIGRRLGKFELADKGTLLLDEIGELSLGLQAKLLRVLQDSTFQRVGGSQELRSDFRLVTATHKDLAREVREGRFREDLYFRIVVFELDLPSLRHREGDVDLLIQHFLEIHQRQLGTPIELSVEARDILRTYSWPGNVRELEHVIHRAVVSSESNLIEPRHLPERVQRRMPSPFAPTASLTSLVERQASFAPSLPAGGPSLNLVELEAIAIQNALTTTRGNLAHVSRLLGISRATLYRKLKKYGLR